MHVKWSGLWKYKYLLYWYLPRVYLTSNQNSHLLKTACNMPLLPLMATVHGEHSISIELMWTQVQITQAQAQTSAFWLSFYIFSKELIMLRYSGHWCIRIFWSPAMSFSSRINLRSFLPGFHNHVNLRLLYNLECQWGYVIST